MTEPVFSETKEIVEQPNPITKTSSQNTGNFLSASREKNHARWFLLGVFALCFVILMTGLRSMVFSNVEFGGDFFTFWLGGRSVFIDGQSPYREEVTLQSQMGLIGRKANTDEDQVAFAYPPYSLWVVLPAVWLDLPWALSYWLALNLVLVFAACGFVLGRAPKWILITALLFYPLSFSLIIGNFTTIILSFMLFIIGAVILNRRPSTGAQIGAGVLLAWITIKPQYAWLMILFILLYTLKNHLKVVWCTFLLSLAGFVGLSFILVPGWVSQWLVRLGEYSHYVDIEPLMVLLPGNIFPENIAKPIGIALGVAGAAATLWFIVKWWQGKVDAFFVITWICLFSSFVQPNPISLNHQVFLIPMLLWSARQYRRSQTALVVTWVGGVVSSWLMFFLSQTHILPQAVNQFIWVFFAGWVVWVLIQTRASRAKRAAALISG